MGPKLRTVVAVVLGWMTAEAGQIRGQEPRPRLPNIVLILADDLGYGDLGSFGQRKIRTPNLDRLAREGLRLTQHYSGNSVCAPSRCVLMTGRHPGHAFVRDNREVRPEGQVPLPEEAVTLAELLRQQGYATGAFGKWGLGFPGSSGDPLAQGFDRFFGYNCQRVAHNFYPTSLWDNNRQVALDNPEFAAHQRFPADADASRAESYAQYQGRVYAPDLITEAALRFVRENRERPFFLYFPSTIPHLALQVPEDGLAAYRDAFPEEPYLGDRAYLPHFTPRAAYAAMVTRLDQHVGLILELLNELHLADSTIVVFSSDNGPLYDRLGGTDTDFFQSARDLRGRKGSLYEGGVRVPTIVRWPNHIAAGNQSDYVSGFEDWLPTFLHLIGREATIPADVDGVNLERGREQAPRAFLYREFPSYGGQQSIRVGDWKAVRQNLKPRGREPDVSVQLYHLGRDPQESTDVAAEHPQIVEKLLALMRAQHTPSETFPLPALDEGR
jgi:arylsulfatase A